MMSDMLDKGSKANKMTTGPESLRIFTLHMHSTAWLQHRFKKGATKMHALLRRVFEQTFSLSSYFNWMLGTASSIV